MTPLLQQWVLGGGLVDTIIGITLFETAVLLLYQHQTKRGMTPRDYLLNVASGLCLMLALRCTLFSAGWQFISLWLAAAGLAHVIDIAMRLRQRAKAL